MLFRYTKVDFPLCSLFNEEEETPINYEANLDNTSHNL